MRKHWTVSITFIILTLFCTNQLFSQTRNRDEIPDKYKWDLTDLYPSLALL